MKRSVLLLALFSVIPSAYCADFQLERLGASDVAVNAAVPAAVAVEAKEDTQAPQDLVYKFQQASRGLNAVRNDLTWVRNDIDDLERRAARMIQMNSSDAFFQFDLRRMSSDMSRRFGDLQRAAMDVRNLLNQAQKSAELNRLSLDMDWAARDILRDTWPTLENSAQRLEWTVRSGKPEIVGYDAQWTAMDISRYCRQLSDQARNVSYDTRELVSKTQP
jgi:Mg2+ and Co2+ transporter CorA